MRAARTAYPVVWRIMDALEAIAAFCGQRGSIAPCPI